MDESATRRYRVAVDEGLPLLEDAIASQRALLATYEKPAEPLVLETVRVFDQVFCRPMFPEPDDAGDLDRGEASIMADGVNHALSRVMPETLGSATFRVFPSTDQTRAQADSFVFHCGVLARAERQASLLREGLLTCHVEKIDPTRGLSQDKLLLLEAPSIASYAEAIGRQGERWASAQTSRRDRLEERELERRHKAMLPMLDASVYISNKYYLGHHLTVAMMEHFQHWAELYLRRMPHQDMIAPEEKIGGRPFDDYLAALTVLATRSHMQLCFAGMLKHRHPALVFRNLLTDIMPYGRLLEGTASAIGSTTAEARALLSHLLLEPASAPGHLERGDPAWAPAIRCNEGHCIMPVFGLDMNPFLYLLNDLRVRYPDDWFRLANNREGRWLRELDSMFAGERWATNSKNLKLKSGGKTVTDIDFALQDTQTKEIAVFQLKWQQPTLTDPTIRRSNASNLLVQCNSWIERVEIWTAENGVAALADRLGFEPPRTGRVQLFVVARYGAHFAGHGDRLDNAIWSDWSHFRKARAEKPHLGLRGFAAQLDKEIAKARRSIRMEQQLLPLPGLAVGLNISRAR